MAILVCQPAIGLLSLSLKPAKGSSGLCRMLGNAMQWQPASAPGLPQSMRMQLAALLDLQSPSRWSLSQQVA